MYFCFFYLRLLLLNQFHDVLPGSCIQLVTEDAMRYYSGEMIEYIAGERCSRIYCNRIAVLGFDC